MEKVPFFGNDKYIFRIALMGREAYYLDESKVCIA